MMNNVFIVFVILTVSYIGTAKLSAKMQKEKNSKKEIQTPLNKRTAQTGLKPSLEKTSYDVKKYDIKIQFFPSSKSLSGKVTTDILIIESRGEIEFDLDPRFKITEVLIGRKTAKFRRKAGRFFIKTNAKKDDNIQLSVSYKGVPFAAKNAPWDGGFTWSKDKNGKDWIGVSVQGEGCDLWWPCKDSFTDKPDSVTMSFTVPAGLSAASNGKLINIEKTKKTWAFHWQLDTKISPYNISVNIADYILIKDHYISSNGLSVPIEFWALNYNAAKAKKLVKTQVIPQVKFLEKHIGPYPWAKEKLGFAETPYLGMEHQTINAYGNGYKISEYGFDWLLQHELAHEWFGNLITHAAPEDMWLHEGFAMYMQPFYAGHIAGGLARSSQLYKFYLLTSNCKPAVFKNADSIAQSFKKGDPYYSGVMMAHMLRSTMGDKAFFNSIKRLLYGTKSPNKLAHPLKPRSRTTAEYLKIVSEEAGKDFTALFDIYLYQKSLPELKLKRNGDLAKIIFQSSSKYSPSLNIPIHIDGKLKIVPMVNGLAQFRADKNSLIVIDPDFKIPRKLSVQKKCK